MKKKIKLALSILSVLACAVSCFFCFKTTGAVKAMSEDNQSTYNYVKTMELPDSEQTETLKFSDKETLNSWISVINTLLGDEEISSDEILILNTKKGGINNIITAITTKETSIKNNVVAYFEKVIEADALSTLAKVNDLKTEYSQTFRSEIVMGFVNGSDLTIDVAGTLTTQKLMLKKAYSIVNVKYINLTYETKKLSFETAISGLKKIPEITEQDKDELKDLLEEIEKYYDEVASNIDDAGITVNKTNFETDFARFKWQVQVRIDQITKETNTTIIWIATGIILGIAFAWFGVRVLIEYVKKRKRNAERAKEGKK